MVGSGYKLNKLSFTHNETEYFMRRTERFMRLNDKINSVVNVSLSYTKKNGERSTPEKDITIVEEKLTRIIPKSILEGITFDGERMKKLNIVDDSSKKVIKKGTASRKISRMSHKLQAALA